MQRRCIIVVHSTTRASDKPTKQIAEDTKFLGIEQTKKNTPKRAVMLLGTTDDKMSRNKIP